MILNNSTPSSSPGQGLPEETPEYPTPPYEQIDPPIRNLVRVMNEWSGIHTVASCAGHEDDPCDPGKADVLFVADSQYALNELLKALPHRYETTRDNCANLIWCQEPLLIEAEFHAGANGDGMLVPHGVREGPIYYIVDRPLYRMTVPGVSDERRHERLAYIAEELKAKRKGEDLQRNDNGL